MHIVSGFMPRTVLLLCLFQVAIANLGILIHIENALNVEPLKPFIDAVQGLNSTVSVGPEVLHLRVQPCLCTVQFAPLFIYQ